MDKCVERFHIHGKFKFYRAKGLLHKHAACIDHEREGSTLQVVSVRVAASKRREEHIETFPTLLHRDCPGHGVA